MHDNDVWLRIIRIYSWEWDSFDGNCNGNKHILSNEICNNNTQSHPTRGRWIKSKQKWIELHFEWQLVWISSKKKCHCIVACLSSWRNSSKDLSAEIGKWSTRIDLMFHSFIHFITAIHIDHHTISFRSLFLSSSSSSGRGSRAHLQCPLFRLRYSRIIDCFIQMSTLIIIN